MSIRFALACAVLLAPLAAVVPAGAQDTMQNGSNMKNGVSRPNTPSGMAHKHMIKSGAMSRDAGLSGDNRTPGATMAHGDGQTAPPDASPHP